MIYLLLTTVPGFLAAVRVGTGQEAPVRVTNRQATRQGNKRLVETRTGHKTEGCHEDERIVRIYLEKSVVRISS